MEKVYLDDKVILKLWYFLFVSKVDTWTVYFNQIINNVKI